MVAGLLVFAWGAVNGASSCLGLDGIADQNVVNAQPPVFLETQHAVVPPGKAFLGLLKHAKRIGQAQVQQGLKVRSNPVGFVVYSLLYSLILQPACVWGYLSEVFSRTKNWGTK